MIHIIKKYAGLFLLLVSTIGVAQSPDKVFDQGTESYQRGDYSAARGLYESILKNGYEGADLYYNLGNTYYRLRDIGKAIVNYERAIRLSPNDDDLRHNLELANLMVADKIEPTPRLFVWDYWDSLKSSFSLTSLAWTAYAFFLLLFGALTGVVVGRAYWLRKIMMVTGGLSLVLLVLATTLLAGKLSMLDREDFAVVTGAIATVKNSPDPKSSDAFVLHPGVKIQITDRVNTWVKIRLADGKVGWMQSDAAEII